MIGVARRAGTAAALLAVVLLAGASPAWAGADPVGVTTVTGSWRMHSDGTASPGPWQWSGAWWGSGEDVRLFPGEWVELRYANSTCTDPRDGTEHSGDGARCG